MRVGKLTNEQLDRLILGKLKHRRSEVVMYPGIGVDCTAVDIGNRLTIISSDISPSTCSTSLERSRIEPLIPVSCKRSVIFGRLAGSSAAAAFFGTNSILK